MRYQRFGKTHLNLSVFSLGTMRCLSSPENAKNTIYQAVELGINHIETARGYGQSEIFLGKALKSSSIPREQLIITTKIPPVATAQIMEQYIQESLQRLQLDYIDCLAIHGINTPEHLELIQKNNGCMQAVWQAKNQGLIRHIGFSTHGEQSVIIKAIETGFFEFINLHYYYFFQRHEPIIELAHTKDLGILIISPADKGGQLYTPPPLLQELCDPLSPLELNYRFLLSDPRITTLTVGAAHPEELKLPLESADKNQPLTPEEIEIFQRLETHLKTTLKTDICSQCYQCLPCPENINIPEVLRLRNLSRGYNMIDYGKYRYRMFENAGHWFWGKKGNRCTDCGECLPRCPEKLEIPLLLKETHEMLNGTERRRLWEEKNN